MTRHEDRIRILHALDAARKAVRSTQGWQRAQLNLDELETLGLIRLLEVIGEAANAVSDETRAE